MTSRSNLWVQMLFILWLMRKHSHCAEEPTDDESLSRVFNFHISNLLKQTETLLSCWSGFSSSLCSSSKCCFFPEKKSSHWWCSVLLWPHSRSCGRWEQRGEAAPAEGRPAGTKPSDGEVRQIIRHTWWCHQQIETDCLMSAGRSFLSRSWLLLNPDWDNNTLLIVNGNNIDDDDQ